MSLHERSGAPRRDLRRSLAMTGRSARAGPEAREIQGREFNTKDTKYTKGKALTFESFVPPFGPPSRRRRRRGETAFVFKLLSIRASKIYAKRQSFRPPPPFFPLPRQPPFA